MNAIPKFIRTSAVAFVLTTSLAAQQPPTSGSGANPPAANPGFGPQAPNDATLSGGQPHLNSTYQKDRNGNQGFDLGWIGLLGLAGLFGLAGRRTSDVTERKRSQEMSHSPGMS
jgi:MYXO-CTERM domain-containing protein